MDDKKQFDSGKYRNEFSAKTYDRVNLTLYKGQKAWLIGQIPEARKSLNAYIQRAIRDRIITDGGDVAAWDALAPQGAAEQDD